MYTDPAPPARKGASKRASGAESLVIHSSVPNSALECLSLLALFDLVVFLVVGSGFVCRFGDFKWVEAVT